jgi:hypothetical protein
MLLGFFVFFFFFLFTAMGHIKMAAVGNKFIAASMETWSSLLSKQLTNMSSTKECARVILDLCGPLLGRSLRGQKTTNDNKICEPFFAVASVTIGHLSMPSNL